MFYSICIGPMQQKKPLFKSYQHFKNYACDSAGITRYDKIQLVSYSCIGLIEAIALVLTTPDTKGRCVVNILWYVQILIQHFSRQLLMTVNAQVNVVTNNGARSKAY